MKTALIETLVTKTFVIARGRLETFYSFMDIFSTMLFFSNICPPAIAHVRIASTKTILKRVEILYMRLSLLIGSQRF